jgi:hypothetical protein
MADAPAYVGLQSQPPDVLGRLSQLLQIRGQQASVQQTEQDTRQRQALAKYDYGKHVGEDGTFDLNSVAADPELRAAAGDYYLDTMAKVATAKQMQLEAKSKLFALRGDQVKALGQTLGPLLSDQDVVEGNDRGKQKVNEAWMQYGLLHGEEALPALAAYAPAIKNAPPEKLAQTLRMIQMQATDAASQIDRQMPRRINKGDSWVNDNPLATPGTAPDIKIGVSPEPSILTNAKGNQFRFNPQTNSLSPVGTGRGGQPSPSASPSDFTQYDYIGQAEDIKRYQDEVSTVRTQADQAPQQRGIFKKILKLSDDTNTGPLVSFFQNTKIGGQVFGDNYQELSKYLEKNAIANMQAMGGGGSDARLEAAVAASGSTRFNPDALRAVTEFNYATNSALEQYRSGIDKAVGTDKQDYSKLPQFKADWAKNFDVDVFRIENAERDGDKKALEALRKEILSTPGRAKELQEKRRNLEALSKNGRLP